MFTKRRTNGTAKIVRDRYSNSTTKWWDIRKDVFERDGGKCRVLIGGRICGRPGNEVHHIRALSVGGTTTKANLITICKDCHDARHSHLKGRKH